MKVLLLAIKSNHKASIDDAFFFGYNSLIYVLLLSILLSDIIVYQDFFGVCNTNYFGISNFLFLASRFNYILYLFLELDS
jgi:hypothetical protein